LHGPNEFLVTGNYKDWNRWNDLENINVPTLVLGSRYDSMSMSDQEEMNRRIPNSKLAICENGSHLAMWDDADNYFSYLKEFIAEVEDGSSNKKKISSVIFYLERELNNGIFLKFR